jgi:thymidine kinase
MLQPAKDRRLRELRATQFSLALNEACFFARSSAVVVNSVWSALGICVIVFMGRGLSWLL